MNNTVVRGPPNISPAYMHPSRDTQLNTICPTKNPKMDGAPPAIAKLSNHWAPRKWFGNITDRRYSAPALLEGLFELVDECAVFRMNSKYLFVCRLDLVYIRAFGITTNVARSALGWSLLPADLFFFRYVDIAEAAEGLQVRDRRLFIQRGSFPVWGYPLRLSFVLAENGVNDFVYIQLLSTPQPRGGYQLV